MCVAPAGGSENTTGTSTANRAMLASALTGVTILDWGLSVKLAANPAGDRSAVIVSRAKSRPRPQVERSCISRVLLLT